jgi:hypothetical protein
MRKEFLNSSSNLFSSSIDRSFIWPHFLSLWLWWYPGTDAIRRTWFTKDIDLVKSPIFFNYLHPWLKKKINLCLWYKILEFLKASKGFLVDWLFFFWMPFRARGVSMISIWSRSVLSLCFEAKCCHASRVHLHPNPIIAYALSICLITSHSHDGHFPEMHRTESYIS